MRDPLKEVNAKIGEAAKLLEEAQELSERAVDELNEALRDRRESWDRVQTLEQKLREMTADRDSKALALKAEKLLTQRLEQKLKEVSHD